MTALPTNWGAGMIPGQAAPGGMWQQVQQNMMTNPMFGMGIGLLSGSLQGQPGAGLNVGLQNMLQMQRANEATTLLGARIQEMKQQREAQEAQRQAVQQLYSDPNAALAAQAGEMQLANRLQFPEQKPGKYDEMLAAVGLEPGTPEAQQFVRDVVMKPQTQIQMGGGTIKPTEAQQLVGPGGEKPAIGMTWEEAQQAGFRYQSPTEQKEARQAEEVIGRANDAFTNYRDTLKRIGPTIIPGKDKMELQSAYTNMLLEAKELFNLGALTGPDMGLIQQTLQDPTSIQSQFLEPGDFDPQLDVIQKKLQDARARAKEQYGDNAEIIDWTELPD